MPSSGATCELYCDIIAFKEFYDLQYNSFDLKEMQRQVNEVIQEMASKLMVENIENFTRAQEKKPYLNVEFDRFLKMLLVHSFL